MTKKIAELTLENTLVSTLTGETTAPSTPRSTPHVAYTLAVPQSVRSPEIVLASNECAELLGLEPGFDLDEQNTQILTGNWLAPNMRPYAARYGGHQFGHWAGQLGDGRAMTLAEVLSVHGRFDLQLKGAGRTAYSRRGDGLAVLRSSVREFLCSEAMFHLGVPTTRALSVSLTGESVLRDMFYDGNAEYEPGAICARVAPSFVRFGNFQIYASLGEFEQLEQLTRHVLKTYYPQFNDLDFKTAVLSFFEEVCSSTAKLMAEWMRVGFVHGVMNTDNMSIHGVTIDYGPYGFLEGYDPDWTPNTTDASQRRYRFGAQGSIAMWNLSRLAEALAPLLGEIAQLEKCLDMYPPIYEREFLKVMRSKLGLPDSSDAEVIRLMRELDRVLRIDEIDYTLFYRQLARVIELPIAAQIDGLKSCFYAETISVAALRELEQWLREYEVCGREQKQTLMARQELMDKNNPYFILRNYLVVSALTDFDRGDRSTLLKLARALKTPYEENELTKTFSGKRPEWARHKAGCSMLSCSS